MEFYFFYLYRVRSFIDSDLSDSDNIVPSINLFSVLLFFPFILIHRSGIFEQYKAWISVQQFDLGTGSRKKVRTGQGSQKVTKCMVIFCLFGEKPPLYRLKPKFAWW